MTDTPIRSKKFFIAVTDERFLDNVQFNVLTLLNTDTNLLLNQYGKVFSTRDLGEFDITKEGQFGVLSFFPIDERINDYTYSFISFSFEKDNILEESSVLLGDLINVGSYSTARTNNFSKIIQIPFEYSSAKLNIQVTSNNNYQFDEINFTHNQSELSSVQYGSIFSGPLTNSSLVGLGTYSAYIENNSVFIDFNPNVTFLSEVKFNISSVSIANTNFLISGEQTLKNVTLASKKTVIAASPTPSPVGVASHGFEYQASYYIAQCVDLTNNRTQISEIVVINSRTQSYLIEYASTFTDDRIGVFSSLKTLDTELLFTPQEDIDVEVVVYQQKISSFIEFSDSTNVLDLTNLQIVTGLNRAGIDGDFISDFNLTHRGRPIFERFFNGSNSSIVNIENNTILLPGHFFVTGEKVNYFSNEFDENNNTNSIGIAFTDVPGIGVTNKLPKEVYVVKVNDLRIKLAKTAEDALKILPKTLDFTSVGIENTHKIVSEKQKTKSLISIDNVIQSPIAIDFDEDTSLSENVSLSDFSILVNNEKIFSSGNLLSINNEIMRVLSVGIGSTNALIVRRSVLGSNREDHLSGSSINKIIGNYNIVGNKIYFSAAPYGLTPAPLLTDSLDEQDYLGLQVSSTFDGRVFLRSGIPLNDFDTYSRNYSFDDISAKFDGITKEFTLTQNDNNITDIEEDNSIILINSIFQSPRGTQLSNVEGSYYLNENSNKTDINFVGAAISNPSDINTASIPFGGVIVSVGSTEGFGYQPLVAAGGTATVSIAGTISNISIGNSGSGYRTGIQTQINVGVKTYSNGIPNIEIIGIASISDGNVVGLQITNPGSGYTNINPPEVVFDAPVGYVSLPLIYSGDSQPGLGTEATIDLIVGQQSGIIDFNINNYGYGYKKGDILTVSIGGTVGIPTITNVGPLFSEFKIFVDQIVGSKFSGWSMGQFEVLDNLDSRFNGTNKNFQISFEGKPISISKKKGSPIELEYVLLVFINDVLQKPFKDYTFTGSVIRFNSAPRGFINEPPQLGDTSKIIFYKGTRDIDVEFVEILDSPKVGDNLTIKSDVKNLSQKGRIVELISAIDVADTNKYSDIGISGNESLLRPVTWCKQDQDLYIFNKPVTKDRKIYNPYINPVTNIIKDVNSADNEIFVESVKLFFDYAKENISEKNLNIIEIISNDENILNYEKITNIQSYEGDFGLIVGIGTTSIIGIADTCLTFDLFVPEDSYLRNIELNTGISTEGISGIQTGYRLSIFDTRDGDPNISFNSDSEVIGIGTIFLNNIYECLDFSIEQLDVVGIGITDVTRIIVSVDSYSGITEFGNNKIYGKYSWGRILAPFRSNPKDFNINTPTNISSNPLIRRKNYLKNDLYLP
jgi:hypothetical protein